jgi:hypothetical protein
VKYLWFHVLKDTSFETVVHIVRVRNPLDIVVSAYFSFEWAHPGAEAHTWFGEVTPVE